MDIFCFNEQNDKAYGGNMFKIVKQIIITIILSSLIIVCNGGAMEEKTTNFPILKDVPASKWEELSQKKIYFGHQSVGYNIITGINKIMAENPQIKLNIVKTTDIKDFNGAVFAHDWIGENMNPQSKIEDFENILRNGIGEKTDIAFMKFCYVDVTSRTDIEKVFEGYKITLSKLTKKYPETTFVHVTVPLTSKSTGLQALYRKAKNIIKKIIGKPVFDYRDNINRSRLNEMLRAEYDGQCPIFDLAKLEAGSIDGNISVFYKDGKKYITLTNEYTYDGGHLNEKGSRKVAEQLLVFLANLPK